MCYFIIFFNLHVDGHTLLFFYYSGKVSVKKMLKITHHYLTILKKKSIVVVNLGLQQGPDLVLEGLFS